MKSSIATTVAASLASALTLGCSQPVHTPDAAAGGMARPVSAVVNPCRGYQDVLAEELQGAFAGVGIDAEVVMHITLVGNRITQVERVSGPSAYEPYIRAALAKVHCPTDGGTNIVVMPMIFRFRELP